MPSYDLNMILGRGFERGIMPSLWPLLGAPLIKVAQSLLQTLFSQLTRQLESKIHCRKALLMAGTQCMHSCKNFGSIWDRKKGRCMVMSMSPLLFSSISCLLSSEAGSHKSTCSFDPIILLWRFLFTSWPPSECLTSLWRSHFHSSRRDINIRPEGKNLSW